jgi:hypothetical protein
MSLEGKYFNKLDLDKGIEKVPMPQNDNPLFKKSEEEMLKKDVPSFVQKRI